MAKTKKQYRFTFLETGDYVRSDGVTVSSTQGGFVLGDADLFKADTRIKRTAAGSVPVDEPETTETE